MNRSEYQALTKGVGASLRAIYRAAASRYTPTRSDLAGQLDAAAIHDADLRRRVLEEAVELANKARNGASRLQLTQLADRGAVGIVRELQKADSLIGADEDALLPGEHAEQDAAELERVAAVIAAGGEEAYQRQQEAAAERERLAKLGIRVAEG